MPYYKANNSPAGQSELPSRALPFLEAPYVLLACVCQDPGIMFRIHCFQDLFSAYQPWCLYQLQSLSLNASVVSAVWMQFWAIPSCIQEFPSPHGQLPTLPSRLLDNSSAEVDRVASHHHLTLLLPNSYARHLSTVSLYAREEWWTRILIRQA